jgi:Zn-dependent protease with chaperone function
MLAQHAATASLPALYFDGVHGKGHAVHLHIDATHLRIIGVGISRAELLRTVQWPERTRHGVRIAHLDGGGSVQSEDAAAWDAWSQSAGLSDTWVVRMQQSWRAVAASVVALLVLVVTLQQWGVPLAARAVVAVTSRTVDAAIGDYTLAAIDAQLLQPSKLPVQQAQHLREAFARAVASLPAGTVPQWELVFRSGKIGPNALALPNGVIILTDDMVEMVDGNEDVLVGVLAHELGHVQHRHGMRMLVQVAALGAFAGAVVGDFSSLLAGVPVLLGQASYSRQSEQEADAMAVVVLRQARVSPAVMVTMFEKLGEWRARKAQEGQAKRRAEKAEPASVGSTKPKLDAEDALSWLGIAFSSHPADEQRILYFQEAARAPR